MIKRAFIILALTTLSACATLTGGYEQEIAVSTTPAGAKCLFTNGQESWTVETTPGAVSLPRAFQPIRVSCSLTGYVTAHAQLEPQTRGRAYGNILLLGLPTLVDASTGAGYEYTPEAIALTLAPLTAAPAK